MIAFFYLLVCEPHENFLTGDAGRGERRREREGGGEQERGSEREREPRCMNYSELLCTTPLSAGGGRDGWVDGWRTDEEMKSK